MAPLLPAWSALRRRVLPWLTIVLSACAACASDTLELGRPFIENFTARDYHGRPTLFGAVQGANGLMYFVNYGAVVIYDGRTWEYIEVSNVPLLAVLPISDEQMYVAPFDDIGRIDRDAAGKWQYESFRDRLPAEVRPPGRVWNIVRDGADVLFSTDTAIVLLRNGDPAHATLWPQTTPASFPAPRHAQQSVRALKTPGSGTLCWFRRGVGLHEYRDGKLTPYLPHVEALRDPRIAWVTNTADGEIRFTWDDGQVFSLDRSGNVKPWPHQADVLLASTFVRSVAVLPDGGMYFATANNGAVLVDANGNLRHHLNDTNGLGNNAVNGGLLDRDGGIWVTHTTGVSRVELDPRATLFDRTSGLAQSGAFNFSRHRGRLVAGSDHGLLRLVPGDGRGHAAHWEKSDVIAGRMRAVTVFDDEVLAGTMVDFGRWVESRFEVLDKLPGQAVDLAAFNGRLLLGHETGIRVYDRAQGSWQHAFDVLGISSPVVSQHPDGPEHVWVGTITRGLMRVHIPHGARSERDVTVVRYGPSDGIPGDGLVLVDRTSEGFVFRTFDTVYRFSHDTNRFLPDPRFQIDGQPVRTGDAFEAVPDGRIFAQVQIVGSRGVEHRLGWFQPDGRGGLDWHGLPNRYVRRLGAIGAEELYYEERDGEQVLWASGADASLRIVLDVAAPPMRPPQALIRSAARGDTRLQPQMPRLPYSPESIRFSFASPAFQERTGLRFQTRLVGFNDAWSPASDRGDIEFTNLHGGEYRFEVRALDADNQIGPPAHLAFAIAAPWYFTPWAFAGYVVGAGLGIVGFVRWRLRASERERQRLERVVAERTAELEAAKNVADEANHAKTTFLANMSHELRTPLNGVIGYAQVLMKDHELSDKNRERLRIIQTSGEHLLRMINEVLDFSKIEAGRMELTTTPFHLPQMLRDVAAAVSARFEQKQLEFGFDPAPDLPDLVLGDPLKLRQVLENLLGNALKFTSRGSVRLQVRLVAPEMVEFSVTDTGVGISEVDLERLFQPFQQATDNRPQEPGTGLGLAISQRMVELMDGKLEVESRPGAGSRFFFIVRLPVIAADAAARHTTASIITGYNGRRRKLLVVDDIATNRHVLRDLLTPLGFEVSEAASGMAALALAPELQPDLVFLDLRMPGIDGLELASRLRQQAGGDKLKLIAMSASVLSFNREKAFAAGCDDFLPKPFREDDLLARIGLALQLEWVGDADRSASKQDSRSPFATLHTQLPPDVLAELLAIARRGEVAQLRKHLELLKGDPFADALDTIAKTYRMERIREMLERQLSSRLSR